MNEFINVKVKTEPESTLFLPEIEVLLQALKIANAYLYTKQGILGSFIIDGQKYGEPAQLVMRGNFCYGDYSQVVSETEIHDSDKMAEDSIDEVLEWTREGDSRYQTVFSDRISEINGFSVPKSGIYRKDELLVLILNATHGRFLASIMLRAHAGQKINDEDKWLLCIIAACFAQMGKEDTILQESVASVLRENEGIHTMKAGALVEEWFERSMLPTIKEWHKWHEPLNSAGELVLFFE